MADASIFFTYVSLSVISFSGVLSPVGPEIAETLTVSSFTVGCGVGFLTLVWAFGTVVFSASMENELFLESDK